MVINEYKYKGYDVEIHEHPIYHDFEYVVKLYNEVKFVSKKYHKTIDQIYNEVESEINTYIDKCK